MKKLIAKAQEDSVTLILLTIVTFLCGIIIGFISSPIKAGISCGSNNTVINKNDDDDFCYLDNEED